MTLTDGNLLTNGTRRQFLKTGSAALAATAVSWNAKSYAAIAGANDRVRVGVVGCGDRMKQSLIPAFLESAKELNFEFVAISDLWSRRREEGVAYIQKLSGATVDAVRNNDELYARKDVDAVLVATADFQHALHGVEAVNAGRDAYVEKPTAHTMADAKAFRAAVHKTGKIVQVGTQRRSTPAYIKAADYIKSGQFGDIVMVEMTWNVNQPGRWRRPDQVPLLKEEDTDWKRYLLNRPHVPFDARKYLEFRLFWPYSSGIPDQWLVHQIDTVHWFTGLPHPRSVVANGGIYLWKDGREVPDTMTVAMEHEEELLYTWDCGFGNERLSVTEDVMGTAGTISRTPQTIRYAPEKKNRPDGNEMVGVTKTDPKAHMQNFFDAVRGNREPNCPFELGYRVSIACRMAVESYRQQRTVRWDPIGEEIV